MTTEPKHRRFPFMDGLVLAIAAGEKDVTRRMVRNPAGWRLGAPVSGPFGGMLSCFQPAPPHFGTDVSILSPYAPDNIIDVCEALVQKNADSYLGPAVAYRADNRLVAHRDDTGAVDWPWKVKALPARYCPTWAVRHHRRILDVRPERLSWVTDAEAVREGVARLGWAPTREGFLRGFREMHGLDVDADCWLWRIEFSREPS